MDDLRIKMQSRVNRLHEIGALGANYRQGPQGNSITDYRQDYLDRHGDMIDKSKLKSSVEDIRDNRDPREVGTQYLLEREREKASQSNGHSE